MPINNKRKEVKGHGIVSRSKEPVDLKKSIYKRTYNSPAMLRFTKTLAKYIESMN